MILSRGYKGSVCGPHLVTAEDSTRQVGDEPVLMDRRGIAPVVVSRSRAKGSRLISERGLGDVIVLDDGFQHRRLRRQVDIVAVDISDAEAVDGFIEGALLPLGRFREPRAAALARADLLIFISRRFSRAPQELDPRLFRVVPKGLQIYRAFLAPERI